MVRSMMTGDALHAALYAAVHTGTPGDRELYANVCRGAATVLELGCGAGRLFPVLAGSDRRVVGLELDRALLARAQAAVGAWGLTDRVELVHGDMRTVALQRRFDRVVLPFNGLWCLPGRDAMLEALTNAARHLTPGGRVVFDVYRTDEFHQESAPGDLAEDDLHPIARVPVDDTDWEVWERSTWDPAARRIDATYEHRGEDGRRTEITIRHHYLLEAELGPLVEDAGLVLHALSPGLAHDESLVVTAVRADPTAEPQPQG